MGEATAPGCPPSGAYAYDTGFVTHHTDRPTTIDYQKMAHRVTVAFDYIRVLR